MGEFEGIFQGMNFTELQLMSPRFAHMSEPEAVMENVYFKGKQQFVNQPFFPSAKTLRDVDVDTVRIRFSGFWTPCLHEAFGGAISCYCPAMSETSFLSTQ